MTDIEVARAAILDLGSEDYYHLGDAAVYLPTIAEDRRADVAREAMRELLNEGLVRLYLGVFATKDLKVLPLEQALRVLDDASAWDAEATYPKAYCFLNTHAGDAVSRRAGTGPNSSLH
ncbi:MAG TPA: hypothetical protein VF102_03685 [Gemmatimonadaceae bacterium]|jgi:hypothetical protein